MLVATVVGAAVPPASAPADCVPTWATVITSAREAARALGLKAFKVSGCTYASSSETVPCDPEAMRASVEAQLHAAGLYPPAKRLPFAVYAIARNIKSEAGSGSPAEMVAMGESVYARARAEGWPLERVLMKNASRFGRQRGTNPPVSTRQDPEWEDLVAAELVVTGATRGHSRGATHYWSPAVIDSLHRAGKHADTRWTLYDRWTKSYGMAWVGPVAGVNHNRQFLMVEGVKEANPAAWQAAYDAGRAALKETGVPAAATLPVCGEKPRLAVLPWILGVAGLGVLGYVVGKGAT